MALVKPFLNAPIVRESANLRALFTGIWLGWQIESNWAKPVLFAIYSIARPLASAMIIVIMYSVITDGATDQPLFAYIFLGNALYILVSSIVTGISWAVIDDREHYRVMKQLHTTPMSYYAYLIGRGVARMLIGTISVIITIVFGVIMFDLPVNLLTLDWTLFIVSMIFGVIAMQGIGLMLGALTMQLHQNLWFIGETVIAGLFIVAGAIFPLDVLPPALRVIGFLYPVMYWLELTRRAILGANAPIFQTLAGYSSTTLMLILAVMAVVFFTASFFVYRWSLYHAKEQGRLDMETSF